MFILVALGTRENGEMAGKGKAAVKELGENLIRMAQKGDLAGIKDILDNEEDTEFLVAAINFREQKVQSNYLTPHK